MSAKKTLPILTTEALQSADQCPRRFHLEHVLRASDLMDPPQPMMEYLAAGAEQVANLARDLVLAGRDPKSVADLVDFRNIEKAAAATRLALRRRPRPHVMVAPVFRWRGLAARPPMVLQNTDGSWDVIDTMAPTPAVERNPTKAATTARRQASKKDRVVLRLAHTVDLMRRLNLTVNHVTLLRPDGDYTLSEDRVIDLTHYFVTEDVTDLVEDAIPKLDTLRKKTRELTTLPETPSQEMGSHCSTPSPCPFLGDCTRLLGPDPIGKLNNLRPHQRRALAAHDITQVHEIPFAWSETGIIPAKTDEDDDVALSPLQKLQITSRYTGRTAVDVDGLREWLATNLSEYPHNFVDYETILHPTPVFPEQRPNGVTVVQYGSRVVFSPHEVDSHGRLIRTTYGMPYLHGRHGHPHATLPLHLLEHGVHLDEEIILPDLRAARRVLGPGMAARLRHWRDEERHGTLDRNFRHMPEIEDTRLGALTLLSVDPIIIRRRWNPFRENDPLAEFTDRTIRGKYIGYGGPEKYLLDTMAATHPQFEEAFEVLKERYVDLIDIPRLFLHHPSQDGKCGLKQVGPAWAPPELSYDTLQVHDGGTASALLHSLFSGQMSLEERRILEPALNEYVMRDCDMMPIILDAARKHVPGLAESFNVAPERLEDRVSAPEAPFDLRRLRSAPQL